VDAFTAVVVVVAMSLLMLGLKIAMEIRAMRINMVQLTEATKLIAASKRLSVYLAIERKDGLPISPEQFEANKPTLEARMLEEVEEQIRREMAEKHPGCAAWEIVGGRTGFDSFVTTEVRLKMSTALTRLFTNKDIDGARKLIQEAVAAL
jgi:hypothetical protein